MKRISFLLALLLCLLVVITSFAEITTEEIIEFPTITISVPSGSYLIRGNEKDGYLFICYPEYQSGNTNVSITAAQDTLINFNPVTMDSAGRETFGMTLLSQTTEQIKSYGYTVSDALYSWGDLIEVDGQTGIILKNSMTLSANGQSVSSYSCACMICAGDYRYNFSVGAESEERCYTLLRSFLDTIHWKALPQGASSDQSEIIFEETVLGKAVFLTIMDGSPSQLLEGDGKGILSALFFLDLEKNPNIVKKFSFKLDEISEKAIYTGIDQKGRAFSAFPEWLSEKYLMVALDGENVVKLGTFTDSEMETILKGVTTSQSVDLYFFLGSYQGLCSAIGLDPAPYDH